MKTKEEQLADELVRQELDRKVYRSLKLLESGDNRHSESGEKSQSESSNKNQSPGLCILN